MKTTTIDRMLSKWSSLGSLKLDGTSALRIVPSSPLTKGAQRASLLGILCGILDGDFTVQCWVRPIELPSNVALFTVGYCLNGILMLLKWPGNDVCYIESAHTYGNAYYAYANFLVALAINTWYHVAVVRQNKVCSVYLDRAL